MMGLNEVTHKNITQIRSESVWAQGFVQMSDRSPLLHEGRLPHAYAVLLKPLYHWGLHAQQPQILIVNILCCVSCPKGGRYYSECIRHLELSACWLHTKRNKNSKWVKHSPVPFLLLNCRRYSRGSRKTTIFSVFNLCSSLFISFAPGGSMV